MAITSNDEADAVQLLLDYYFTSADLSHSSAQRAWEILAGAAHDQRGTGWRAIEAAQSFISRSQSVLTPNVTDPEVCDACIDTDDFCEYHRGVLAGTTEALDQAADALKVFARDPEQMDAVRDNDHPSEWTEKQQREERRVAVDEECPGCGWVVRWFDVERAVFGCRKCRYESEYRDK